MYNSTRSGAVSDVSEGKKEPSVRQGERAGKVGDSAEKRDFTIQPKSAVIEISGGIVAFKVGKGK